MTPAHRFIQSYIIFKIFFHFIFHFLQTVIFCILASFGLSAPVSVCVFLSPIPSSSATALFFHKYFTSPSLSVFSSVSLLSLWGHRLLSAVPLCRRLPAVNPSGLFHTDTRLSSSHHPLCQSHAHPLITIRFISETEKILNSNPASSDCI